MMIFDSKAQKIMFEQKNKRTKKYRIIQTLLMISGIVLVCLGGFGVLGAGIFAGLAIGLGSFFVAGVFANIFVSASGYGYGIVNTESDNLRQEVANMECVHHNINFYLSRRFSHQKRSMEKTIMQVYNTIEKRFDKAPLL